MKVMAEKDGAVIQLDPVPLHDDTFLSWQQS
jgi:hypothetical protein